MTATPCKLPPHRAPEHPPELVRRLSVEAYRYRFDNPADYERRIAKVGPERFAQDSKAYDPLTRAFLSAVKALGMKLAD